MMDKNKSLFLLILLVVKNSAILARNYSSECLEELGLKNIDGDDSYEMPCFTKCKYEKEGKLDSNGNFILSKFLSYHAVECLKLIQTTEICKKATLHESCVSRRSNINWYYYEECENTYNYESVWPFDCIHRCQLIVEKKLNQNGSVNTTNIRDDGTIDHEKIIENCKRIIIDEDVCTRDVNMYLCANYMLHYWDPENLDSDIECALEYNIYPFMNVNIFDQQRVCYERCVHIKIGDLNLVDFKKSLFIEKLNISDSQYEKGLETCKLTLQEVDKCSEDLYMIDCMSFVFSSEPKYLEDQKECALETNTPLVHYRYQYAITYDCKSRCLMIKEGQLESDGGINTNYLKKFSINDTIIIEAALECNKQFEGDTCADDINRYYCAESSIHQKVYALCEVELFTDYERNDYNNWCYTRCLMIHNRQLTVEGEVIVDSLKHTRRNVTTIENAINTCKNYPREEHECERDFAHYKCVIREVYSVPINTGNVAFV